MATNTSNITHNNTNDEGRMPVPASQCIPWLVVFITECLAIVILNIITIIVFVKQRQLQRRSTYLIIHLAIVDLLVGAVSGPLMIEWVGGTLCDLWEYNRIDISWLYSLEIVLGYTFPYISLLNLAVISIERLHATFFPFRHRFIKKWVYKMLITFIWLSPIAMRVALEVLYVLLIYFVILLFVICVSYISIYIKVRCSRHPQHHGAARQRERKLTSTLFLVTLGSLLTFLPVMIFYSLKDVHSQLIISTSPRSFFNYLYDKLFVMVW